MSFLQELKRRNVVKVGIAYVVASWLILQLTEVLSELIGLNTDIGKIIIILLVVGFVPALIFAWAFEMTPEGVKRESEVDRSASITPNTGKKLNNTILVMMALAITYLLYDKFSGGSPDSASTPAVDVTQVTSAQEADPAPDSPAPASRQSIAVLPFDNRSRRAEDDPFVEGIHDDLLTNLARIGELKVISRTSVNRYKDTDKSLPEIADELDVATVMEGAVQRSGNTIRINVQLIDANTDEHLWAEIYDRELTAENLFAIQSEISEAIAGALQATLSPDEVERINTRPTQDLAAYEAYQRGRQLITTRQSANIEQAIREFQTAVTLDPEFALAWVGVADAHMLLVTYGTLSQEEAVKVAEDAAQRALALDDQLGEAYAALANVREITSSLQEAEQLFKQAIALSPNYAPAWQWYANMLSWYPNRGQERLQLVQRAAELDPQSSIIQLSLGAAYAGVGLYDLREQSARRVIELDPEFARGYRSLAGYLVFTAGRFDEALPIALRAIELDPGNINNLAALTAIYNALDDKAAHQDVIDSIEDLGPGHWWPAFLSVMSTKRWGTKEATSEAITWALPKMRGQPGFGYVVAQAAAAAQGPTRGLEVFLYLNPDWMNPEAWPQLIKQFPGNACTVGWLFNMSGKPELGELLLEQSADHMRDIAAATSNSGYFFNPQVCHMAMGDPENALVAIERQLERNDLFNWEIAHDMPLFDPIRNEPRYLAALAERQRRLDEQRANVERMRAEGAL